MPVPLFERKPQHCPFGHSLWPGQARVGWKPCICTPAREGAERGRGPCVGRSQAVGTEDWTPAQVVAAYERRLLGED